MSEVATYVDESQFQSGHSVMKCGWYAVWQNHYAGEPGHPATGTGADIEREADAHYVAADGADTANNPRGMSMSQLYEAILLADNRWQNLFPDALPSISQGNLKDLIRQWVRAGYPVIIAVDESTVHDMDLKANPYSWNPQPGQYTHIITVSGLQDNNIDFLCRDTASIASNGVRPGPRKYESTPMNIVSATVFVPTWNKPAGTTPVPTPVPAPAPVVDYKQKVKDLVAQLTEAVSHL